MDRWVERMCGKSVDHEGKAWLADWETKDLKPLAIKPVEVAKVGETPSLTGELLGTWG